MLNKLPEIIPNWIGGRETAPKRGESVEKRNPHDGSLLCRLARSGSEDVAKAVDAARQVQPAWAAIPAVRRGLILHEMVARMKERREEIAAVVAAETGKAPKEALGETDGAIQCGLFFAGEGQRLYGRTCTSGVPGKKAMTVRQPVGVAGLIIAANTPIANVAWKIFPAMICGNAAVLKAPEDTPATAWLMGRIAKEAGLPDGVLNIIQGLGPEAGQPLVEHPDVGVVSFTGSTAVGRNLSRIAGERLARVSLELGGKNALVVCDDADLDKAVRWACPSAFSNAGQRCASGSRVIVFDSVYDSFRDRFVAAADKLRVGNTDDDDLGPVINERQLRNMLSALDEARRDGGVVLAGGNRLADEAHAGGYYLQPTIIEEIGTGHPISRQEIFGPICCLYRAAGYREALAMANDSPYGLTACIHTRNVDRALHFAHEVATGVAVINAGTYGSEPHMPFGGRKASGNGTREPGTEALDIYSELKDIYIQLDDDYA